MYYVLCRYFIFFGFSLTSTITFYHHRKLLQRCFHRLQKFSSSFSGKVDKWSLKSESWQAELKKWKLKSESWKVKVDKWKLTSEGWKVKDEKWKLKSETWKVKDEKRKLKSECWKSQVRWVLSLYLLTWGIVFSQYICLHLVFAHPGHPLVCASQSQESGGCPQSQSHRCQWNKRRPEIGTFNFYL